ncbi:hypothetical protein Tco_1046158, partial [Tanacetum coccineum]
MEGDGVISGGDLGMVSENFYPSKVYNDAGGGRNVNLIKEYVAVTNHVDKVLRRLILENKRETWKPNAIALKLYCTIYRSAAKINGTLALSNGSRSPKLAPK